MEGEGNTKRRNRMMLGNHKMMGGYVFDPIVLAVVAQANTLGYTIPSSQTLVAINNFIVKRRNDGTLALFDLLYMMGLNDTALANFARLNYINPASFQLVNNNSCSYLVGGYQGNPALEGNMSTGYNPSIHTNKFTLLSAARGMWVRTAPTINTALDGSFFTAGAGNSLLSAGSTVHRINSGSNNLDSNATMNGTGYKAMQRPSSSTTVNLFNGNVKTVRTENASALTNDTICLFSRVSGGSRNFSNAVLSMYFIGSSMTDQQHSNINVDFQTFLTEIGL
jgi:hypothetical protein